MSILLLLKLTLQKIFNLLISKIDSFNIDSLTTTITDEFDKLKLSTLAKLIDLNVQNTSVYVADKLVVSKITVSNKMRKFNVIIKAY